MPKPPSPNLLAKEKLSVAAIIVLSEKQWTSALVVPLSFDERTSEKRSMNAISSRSEPFDIVRFLLLLSVIVVQNVGNQSF